MSISDHIREHAILGVKKARLTLDLRWTGDILEIYFKGTQIGEIDNSGNLKLKGDILTNETLTGDGVGITDAGFKITNTTLDIYFGTTKVGEWNGTTGLLKIKGDILTNESL